jgi:uncharacterized protein (DUF1501 family)
MLQRRNLLLSTLSASLGAASLPALMSASAQAQTGGYKALVCIFLYGGNDGLNSITPRDSTRYAQYSSVRGNLALPQGSLVALNADYGLHPALSALSTAWNDGAMAPLFNVGPLYEPLTKDQYRNARAQGKTIPDNLFSHSDQQNLWENGRHEVTERTGWGGRAAVLSNTVVMSMGGNARFGLSDQGAPLVFPGPGSTFGVDSWGWDPDNKRRNALTALYADASTNALHGAYAKQIRDAVDLSAALGATLKINPKDNPSEPINAAFKGAGLIDGNNKLTSGLAGQLYQIAKLIEYRAGLPAGIGQGKHIYFAQLGGFDTHGDQVMSSDVLGGTHARLLKQLGDASAGFYAAIKALGLSSNVTTFTQSDFGRTFKPNSSYGTDHAWGNNHLIMGGAVKGSTTYGTYPTLTLGGPDDVGLQDWEKQGRWIPKTSVDQYAATLLRWWGLNDAQLGSVLPNLKNFSQSDIGFMKPA